MTAPAVVKYLLPHMSYALDLVHYFLTRSVNQSVIVLFSGTSVDWSFYE